MKFAHSRKRIFHICFSKYFTAKLFHLPKANFVEKREQVGDLLSFFLEAPPRFGLGVEVLQTFALPLGHGAIFT